MPGMADDPEEAMEDSYQNASVGQHMFQIVLNQATTVPHDPEHTADRVQHEDVGSRDDKQEDGRSQSRDHTAGV